MRGKYANGFSLIELILVITLIGILFSMVAPRLGGTLGHVTLKSCARDLAMTLNFAHYSAVYKGINYRVNYDLDDNAYWVSSESEQSVDSPVTERWGERKMLPSGIYFRDVTTRREPELTEGTEYTKFSPSGSGEKCVLHLVNAKNEVFTVVVFNALGKTKVLDYDFKFAQ